MTSRQPVGLFQYFALRRALHGDADVGLGDRPAVVGQDDARRLLGGIDAEDVAGGAVQPDHGGSRRAGRHAVLVVEEQADVVGRVDSAPA